MNTLSRSLLCAALLPLSASADTSLTIYNQNFAVVRDSVPLDLQQGENRMRFAETTAQVEPDSVILRDPKGAIQLTILEQNYRADPVSEALLLSLHEGKEIEFFVREQNKPDRVVKGKIIRSGYVPHNPQAMRRYGQQYYQNQMAMAYGGTGAAQPIIEVEGQLQFSLPGQPRFPALADDTILKPTLDWRLHADKAAKLDAELSYVTGGMSWDASYNVISPEKSDELDLTGWVTMDNQSGKVFRDAKIQLIAGDVAKIVDPNQGPYAPTAGFAFSGAMKANAMPPQVTEKSFDEYHLYTLPLATTLHDRETKQVEFVRAAEVQSKRVYVYDGLYIDPNQWRGQNMVYLRQREDFGGESQTKVWVMREFKNSEANKLGMPLPRGRVRFYRRDDDGRLQFVGEDLIDHTAKDETIRVNTGNAFDLVGERRRTDFKVDSSNHWLDESFEIKVRNHKKESVEIRVVEHLFRWVNWEVRQPSSPFTKKDAQTIEYRVTLKPDEEK
ncbi:MAG: DUF4139 domain-containing protein, partial [Roseimicrobium sp.]